MLYLKTHHPNTFEFLPSVSLTTFPDGKVLMLAFGTYTFEFYFDLKDEDTTDETDNFFDNGNQSSCDSASC